MNAKPPVRFIRTPTNRDRDDSISGDATYLAHSVMSLRHAPAGMTFEEIMEDHQGQADTDGCQPFDYETAASLLIECIEAGLVSTLDTRPPA